MKRPVILAAILALICSGIYLLPELKQTPSAMKMEIPEFLGAWTTIPGAPSPKEIKVLANDTEFSKAQCKLPRVEEGYFAPGQYRTDFVELSIVLSGYDLANSIHRPERCMAAQGYRGLLASDAELELRNGRVIPITKLDSYRDIMVGDADNPKTITINFMTYYFFVGHDDITADHTERTLIDIYDRVASGQSQRWAFITASLPYTKDAERIPGDPLLSKEGAERKIQQVIRNLAETNIDWEQIN